MSGKIASIIENMARDLAIVPKRLQVLLNYMNDSFVFVAFYVEFSLIFAKPPSHKTQTHTYICMYVHIHILRPPKSGKG
jgi:hypothetical protein